MDACIAISAVSSLAFAVTVMIGYPLQLLFDNDVLDFILEKIVGVELMISSVFIIIAGIIHLCGVNYG